MPKSGDCREQHNYYLYKPSLDELQQPPPPWHVVNYDSDNAWGQSPWHWNENDLCNCEGVASMDYSDYTDFRPFVAYKVPIFTFSFLVYAFLSALSCWIECRHWGAYKAQHGQLVTPLAPIAAEPIGVVVTVPAGASFGQQLTVDTPDGQQAQVMIPAGLHSGQQFRAEIAQQPASTSTQAAVTPPSHTAEWILPPAVNIGCVKDWRQWEAVATVWGLPRPLVNSSHSAGASGTEVEHDEPDDSAINPVYPAGDVGQQQTLAQAETMLDAQGADSPAERAQLAFKWMREKSYAHPSRASCASVAFSLFFANSVGLLNMAFGVLIYWHALNVCCCGPLLRCWDGRQARKLQRTKTNICCANADDTPGCSCCCFIYAAVVYLFGMSIAANFGGRQGTCYRDCEMTGFDMRGLMWAFAQGQQWFVGYDMWTVPEMHSNAMESVLDDLALPQYYGLYSDFADASFTQPCVLKTAVEQISGATGILHDPLVHELTHWCMDGVCDRGGADSPAAQSFASEIVVGNAQYMMGWIERKGARVRSILEARCSDEDACLSGASCLTPSSVGCRTEQTCVQGSLTASCAQLERDECGCVVGQGWSKRADACAAGASTSREEAENCASRQAQG